MMTMMMMMMMVVVMISLGIKFSQQTNCKSDATKRKRAFILNL